MTAKTHAPLAITLALGLGLAVSACAESNAELVTDLEVEAVADGFTSPHLLVTPPGDTRRFVVDLVGRIVILDDDGTPRDPPFLDISDRMVTLRESYDERGLCGLCPGVRGLRHAMLRPGWQRDGRLPADVPGLRGGVLAGRVVLQPRLAVP